jgi:LuxR family maltose regulon positive regulatory protein
MPQKAVARGLCSVRGNELHLNTAGDTLCEIMESGQPMVASAPGILQTKLAIPPARAELVARPRLIERFSNGLRRPLTLICAPAGFGKTTLLSEWIRANPDQEMALAWFSLDVDDNDPGRFLTYLIGSLIHSVGVDSDEALSLLQTSQPPPPKVILTALISGLETIDIRCALILDDYHLISNQVIHDALTFLVEHLPLQMHLVLISREDPPLPLARLRARGQLAEIRVDDLRFTLEEATQFLDQRPGIQLRVDQVQDLESRTEGWIAGLQLVALAMQGREDLDGFIAAFTGSHRYILDYLTEEVLNQQPESVRSFLLQTSILNRLSASLCDAITGQSNGHMLLEQIDRSNLFLISLDDERYWFRYHHLFADMLRRHLQHTSPDSEAELHHRASLWFEQNGWVTEAVEHAFAGTRRSPCSRRRSPRHLPRSRSPGAGYSRRCGRRRDSLLA